jgi:hypothetical protein
MSDCRNWYMGMTPRTAVERSQDRAEDVYERDDRWERESRFIPHDVEQVLSDEKPPLTGRGAAAASAP